MPSSRIAGTYSNSMLKFLKNVKLSSKVAVLREQEALMGSLRSVDPGTVEVGGCLGPAKGGALLSLFA